ncbi:unnamed protein product [Lymnaea stagnalis]|uniref:Uncharacterized protein n=1 Tax=Lymnaea stagnalis TaxID=6523 RepID=A0AAV2I0C8_LYMST
MCQAFYIGPFLASTVLLNMSATAIYVFVIVISSALCQDPVLVCQPPIYQTNYTNLLTGDAGYIAVDFNKELLSEISTKTGVRLVLDFKNLRSHEIASNVSCRSSRLQPCKVKSRCLPPYAKPVSTLSGFIGNRIVTNGGINLTTWEIPTEFDVVHRSSFTSQASQPFWPAMHQELGYHGTNSIYLFTNPRVGITDLRVFNIPAACGGVFNASSVLTK